MTATLYIVRHGQTQANRDMIVQGWADSLLTEAGIAVADRDGEALKNIPFDAAYASDLTRARETAIHILQKNHYLKPEHLALRKTLREVSFGSNQGAFGPEMQKLLKAHAKALLQDTPTPLDDLAAYINSIAYYDPLHQAEDFDTFKQRIVTAVTEIAQHHDAANDTVLVVSHGMMIRTLYTVLFPDEAPYVTVLNGGVGRMQFHDGAWQFRSYNENLIDMTPADSWF